MACKPKPQLRMADGGELMRRFANRQPLRMADGGDPFQQMLGRNPGVEANRVASPSPGLTTPAAPQVAALAAPPQFGPGRVDDTQNAARTARMAMYGRASDNANAITAMSNPTAPAADPGRRERMLDAGQRTQTFNPMMGNIQTEAFDPHIRQLALRDGGTVPGKGTGDKIPALYEPGEFVVSNAMLDAEPGLREQLHDLRGNVLAAQGKSVEQADAQAVKGGTLRAASGGALPKLPSLDFLDKRPAPAPAPAPNLTAMNQPGVDSRNAQFAERSAYEAQAAREANPRSMTTKELFSRGDGSVRGSSPLRFNPPGMGPNGVVQTANAPRSMTRAELFNQPKSSIPNNPAGPLKLPTPVAAEPTGRVAKGLAWVDDAMSAAAKSKFVAPVLGALRSPLGQAVGKLGGVGAQLALHHGNAGAPTLDDERVAAMGRPYDPDWQPRSKPYTPRPDSVTPWGNELRRNSPMAGVNGPTAPARGTEDFTKALSTVPDQLPAGLRDGMVYKTKDAKGNVTYSGRNVSGDVSGRMLNGDGTSAGPMRGSLRSAAGAPSFGPNGSYAVDNNAPTGAAKQAQIDATLRNPDGSTWSARDNAVMAANLRDGVDPYRGTSRAAPEEERIPAIGEFGHNKALANQTLRRGQDIQSADNRYGHDLSAATARANTWFQMQKDLRDFGVARYDKGIEQASKFSEQARGAFKNRFDTVDEDGKLVARPDREAAAYDEAVRQSGGRWDQLDPAQRAQYLNDAFDHVKLLSSARDHQNNSIWQAVGLANKDAAHGGMPSAADMQGAKLTELGFGSGATTMNAGRGDYKLTLKNGQVMHFGRGDLSQAQLKRLQDLGASLGDK